MVTNANSVARRLDHFAMCSHPRGGLHPRSTSFRPNVRLAQAVVAIQQQTPWSAAPSRTFHIFDLDPAASEQLCRLVAVVNLALVLLERSKREQRVVHSHVARPLCGADDGPIHAPDGQGGIVPLNQPLMHRGKSDAAKGIGQGIGLVLGEAPMAANCAPGRRWHLTR